MKTVQGTKYLWQLPEERNEEITLLAHGASLSFAIAQALYNRGYKSVEDVHRFLLFTDEDAAAHPRLLKDAEKAVDRLLQALDNQEKILIAGDYDVDGITSSAMLMLCLQPLGAKINFFLPNRARDGYGLSVKTIERAAASGYTVVITVDNGITAFEPARVAKERGIDLIITDHHKPHDHMPDAYAIVNPHRHDCLYPYKYFAGVGVSFKLISLLYERRGLTLPEKAYELLLLGTVADVVPLTGENRYWVRYGLKKIHERESISLSVLKKNGKVTKPVLSATDIGFSITPQINALGRLDDAREGVKFLVGGDLQETERIGQQLLALNEARKTIEKGIYQEIDALIAAGTIDIVTRKSIVASSDQWPAGVIGLVASRLVAAYGRPTVLFHITADGIAKGSARSIASCNMFEVLTHMKDILISFGGHVMAAGLALPVDKLPLFQARFDAYIAENVPPEDFVQKLKIDAELLVADATKKLLSDLSYLEPFGCGNEKPLFYIRAVSLIEKPQLLKQAHVKCMLFSEGVLKPVIFFNRPELYAWFVMHAHEHFDVAVYVVENFWNDRVTIEFQGIDVARSGA